MLRQIMILIHSSSPMLLVICDHTFALHVGIAKIVCLEYKMTNYTMHGLAIVGVTLLSSLIAKKGQVEENLC